MIAAASLALVLAGLLAGFLLRRSWLSRDALPAYLAGGWAVLLAAIALSIVLIGQIKGLALALVMEAIGLLIVVWHGRVTRDAPRRREVEAAPEPLDEPGRVWRGVLRALLAGPLGMTAAMAQAFCLTVYMPGDPRTRIVIGGLTMPVLWGLAMTWTLADRRLLRATAVLVGTSIAGFGLASLGTML